MPYYITVCWYSLYTYIYITIYHSIVLYITLRYHVIYIRLESWMVGILWIVGMIGMVEMGGILGVVGIVEMTQNRASGNPKRTQHCVKRLLLYTPWCTKSCGNIMSAILGKMLQNKYRNWTAKKCHTLVKLEITQLSWTHLGTPKFVAEKARRWVKSLSLRKKFVAEKTVCRWEKSLSLRK